MIGLLSESAPLQTDIFEPRESRVRSYCRSFPVVFERAEGCHLFDTDGPKYIYFLAGGSTLNYGLNDPDMQDNLIEHIRAGGIAHGLDMYTVEKARFLADLEEIILEPRGMDHKVMMTGPNGTNAVEAAMLYGRSRDMDTLRHLEIMFDNRSSGLDALAAFIFEPVQGEGGLNAASDAWMQGVARLDISSCGNVALPQTILDFHVRRFQVWMSARPESRLDRLPW